MKEFSTDTNRTQIDALQAFLSEKKIHGDRRFKSRSYGGD